MMNHIFRVIWNRTLRLWQCVSEKVKSTTKAGPNTTKASTGKVATAVAGAGLALSLLIPPSLGMAAEPQSIVLTQDWVDNIYNNVAIGKARDIQRYGGSDAPYTSRTRYVLDTIERRITSR